MTSISVTASDPLQLLLNHSTNRFKKLTVDNNAVCSQGYAPFSKAWLRQEFAIFARTYAARPNENTYGTKLPHQFALWATIRLLKPETIIESGVYQGQGSWLMRQAAPTARLILLDPRGNGIAYRDQHDDTVYLTDEHFVDFAKVDWKALNVDPSRAFVFFDDHQSGLKRTIQAWRAGFWFIMFDDNASSPNKDNLSVKLACYLKTGRMTKQNVPFKDNFGKIVRSLTDEDLMLVDVAFDQVIAIYYEFPFIYKDKQYKGELLFPDDTYEDVKAKFSLPNTGDKYATAAKSYYNVCFVALRPVPHQ